MQTWEKLQEFEKRCAWPAARQRPDWGRGWPKAARLEVMLNFLKPKQLVWLHKPNRTKPSVVPAANKYKGHTMCGNKPKLLPSSLKKPISV